ncbi:ribosome biogenesis GTP-binding protein YihA/YsxC [Candidatus Cytomitobacter primus]|uniref:Ribosome biogenesis GTP-binding protein YsxC n=1 Tax=Candidatus Cytomitobacter primus TaxID=2066024 RepID=A0A5C0UI26_9PROT|nr:ribosome biogenesis GTP-binding protein YihA/YsxC [Candidatus Cytomitobacter primus]QEK38604.1 ribosome biogenesis GTP-binding protein YsxC [Candidatus Cytomitobacter primus]
MNRYQANNVNSAHQNSGFTNQNAKYKDKNVKSKNKTYFINELPTKIKYEIALIGRSNVGKSSLLNSILNEKTSRVSKKPGCTRWLGYYDFENVTLIDLPGYGYANVSKKQEALITVMVQKYILCGRIDELWILIDSRRGIMGLDIELINFVVNNDIPVKIISTKIDKKESKIIDANFRVSSKTKEGIHEIIDYIKHI